MTPARSSSALFGSGGAREEACDRLRIGIVKGTLLILRMKSQKLARPRARVSASRTSAQKPDYPRGGALVAGGGRGRRQRRALNHSLGDDTRSRPNQSARFLGLCDLKRSEVNGRDAERAGGR